MMGYGSTFPYPDFHHQVRDPEAILDANRDRLYFADIIPLTNLTWDILRTLDLVLSSADDFIPHDPSEFTRLTNAGLETWKHAYLVAHQIQAVAVGVLRRLREQPAYATMGQGLFGERPIWQNRRVLNRYNPTFRTSNDPYSKIKVLANMTVGYFGWSGIGPRQEFEVFFPLVKATGGGNFGENVQLSIAQFEQTHRAASAIIEFLSDVQPLERAWREVSPFASSAELGEKVLPEFRRIVSKWETRFAPDASDAQATVGSLRPVFERANAMLPVAP